MKQLTDSRQVGVRARDDVAREVPATRRNLQQGPELPDRAQRNAHMVSVTTAWSVTLTLRHIRRNGDSGPLDLRSQAVPLRVGQQARQVIEAIRQVHRDLPGVEVPIRLNLLSHTSAFLHMRQPAPIAVSATDGPKWLGLGLVANSRGT